MPYSLLGTDAILFSVFRALGLKAMVAPVLGDEAWDEWAQIREEKLFRKIYEDEEMEERVKARREESDEEMEDEGVEEEESEEEGDDSEDTARVGKGWWRLKMVGDGEEGGEVFRVGREPSGVSFFHCDFVLSQLCSFSHFGSSFSSSTSRTDILPSTKLGTQN